MALIKLSPEPGALSSLGKAAGEGLGQGLKSQLEEFHQKKKIEAEERKFVESGMPAPLARLAAAATVGGQTAATQVALDLFQRREDGEGMESLFGSPTPREDEAAPAQRPPSQAPEMVAEEGEVIERGPGGGEKEDEWAEIKVSARPEVGRTPKEKVARQEKRDQRSFDRNKKYLDRLGDIAAEIPKEKLALSQMKGALETGNFNSLRNAAADMLGLEVLKDASAQVVNSAQKQFLMASLAGLTGRPNMFIEKQITKALISPLYRNEANELIYDGLEMVSRLKEREVELGQSLESKYTTAGKEIPRNYQELIRKKLEKEARDMEKSYEKKLENLVNKQAESVVMKNPQGQRIAVRKDRVREAQKEGYKLAK